MITVLLAVYNGEKYLGEQIDSIIGQTVSDIKIMIRDDGSTDKSAQIIEKYAVKYPERIRVLTGAPSGGAAANFGELLKCCDDDYIMFADQDDVWFKDKAQKTLDIMLKAENGDKSVPVLVHSDMTVTDRELNVTAVSFFEYQKIIPDDLSLNRLLVQNYVTGCTVMINRALKNKAVPIPCGAAMHDWWLALVASAFGKIETVRTPLMYYRQHGENQVGAKAGSGFAFIARKIKTMNTVKDNLNATYTQAEIMLKSYSDILSEDKKQLLIKYTELKGASIIKRVRTIKRYNFKKGTRLRVFGQYFLS